MALSGSLPATTYKAGCKMTRRKKAEEAEQTFILWAEAYILGEKVLDAKYKNEVVKAVLAAKEEWEWDMGPESVDIVYKGTPSGSPLRRMIADSIAHHAHNDSEKGIGWMEFIDGYPQEALVDALKAMAKLRDRVVWTPDVDLLPLYLEKET
jgi:hypothetical protein